MANLNIKQCSVCHVTIDETWTKFDKLGNYICPCCGSVNFLSEDVNQTAVDNELNSIYPLLENAHFKTAREKLETLRNKYPKSSKAYFLTVLADNYVCFTKDSKEENHYIPTLNDLPDSDLSKSIYAKKALELAESDLVKESYQAIFDYIDKKRIEILEAAHNKENQYDIFISTKVTLLDENSKEILDGNGNPKESPDCANARMIYNYILEKYPGKKIFFSQSEDAKKKMSGQKYENIIYAALHSAKAFILVAESRQSIDWRWVRNEWMRYLRIMEREKGEKHSFVLITHSLTNVDLPGELKDFQFINYSTSADPGSQLKFFLSNALSTGTETKRLEAKTFDNEVEKIELGEIEEAVVTRKLKTRVEEASQDLKIKLGRIAMDFNPERMATREKAFQELEKIVEENPDVYEAKKLLLLKGTKYYHLEDYFDNPKEMTKDASILAKYFEFAPENEAKKIVKDVVGWLIDWENTFWNDTDLFDEKGAATALSSIVMPYLDYIDKKELEELSLAMSSFIPLWTDTDTEDGKIILDSYFSLRHYLDGKDPKKYIKARADLLADYADLTDCDNVWANVEQKLTSEILKINPGDYEIIWFDFCYKHFPKIYKVSEIDILIREIGEEKTTIPIVGNKESIETFKNLFKYSTGKERDAFVSIFLMAIVFDQKSYEKEPGTESLLLTKDIDGDNQIDDYEKNGFDLFKDYIGYNVLNIEYNSSLKEEMKADSPYLKPLIGAYLKKEKPTLLDRLLCSFAVKMHRGHFYEQAVMLYDWYLGEQQSGKTLDALLVRYYKELANVRILDPDELKHVNRRINDSDIKDDLYALSKTSKSAMVLYNKISDIVEKQDRYFDVYQPIKELTNQLPVEKTIKNIDLICEIRDKFFAAINSAPEDLKKDLKEDFSYEIDYFNNKLPELVAAKKKASSKKKAKRIAIVVSTIVSILVAAALLLTFFVFIPQAKQSDYDFALGLLNNGDYQEAALRFEQVDYKDSSQMYYVAKAGASFETGDYETGIEYIHDAGGTVNVTYDSNGGTSAKNSEVLKRKNKWVDNTPTRNGYTFVEWGIDDFALDYSNENYKADLSLKASWDTITYNIVYDTNGGKVPSDIKKKYTAEDEFSLETPTRSGYTFLGWYDSSDNKVESITKGTTGNLELTAKWEANTYTISFEPAGGSVSQTTVNVQYDGTYELPLPVWDGYRFLGWFDGYDNKVDNTGKWTYVSDKSFFAHWELITYHIYYELNGGTLADENPTTYTVEDSFVLEAPMKIGYTFLGWFDGDENKIDSINEGSTGNKTLTAKWSEANSYVVTLDANGGDVSTDQVSVQFDHPFSLPAPTKLGYSFQGWYHRYDRINEDDEWTIADNVTLEAHWTVVNYTITYILNGGTNHSDNPQTYTVEDEVDFDDPRKDGYSFTGWYSNDALITYIHAGSTGPVTVEARWTANKHNLSVNSSDTSKGTVNIVSGSGYTDETIEVEATPKTGNVFLGWYLNNSSLVSNSSTYSFIMPSSAYSLTARFASQADIDLGKIPVATGSIVYYGLYPQDSVTDSSLIAQLNSSATTASNGWYLYNGSYYAKKSSSWYYCQRIEWIRMSNGTLLSRKILDVSQYNSAGSDSKYASSLIRTYLNGTFYNIAFALNSSYITVTTVDNSGPTTNVDNNKYASANTSDKVFIPSYKDCLNLGSCSSTAWANTTTYWTRSPNGTASSSMYAWYVNASDGTLSAGYPVSYTRGIRPCINISF